VVEEEGWRATMGRESGGGKSIRMKIREEGSYKGEGQRVTSIRFKIDQDE
jgi:hypothetical protein